MKVWKNKLVAILFALAGVLFLVPAVKQLAKGEPLDGVAITGLCIAGVCSIILVAVLVGRKSAGGPAA